MASLLSRRRHLAAALLLLSPALAAAQERTPGVLDEGRPEVVEMRITGTRALDADDIRNAIQTEASGCRSLIYRFTICPFYKGDVVYNRAYLDPIEFRRDVLRIKLFYYERGYREAQVDTAVVDAGDDRVRVAFGITEGEPTRVDTVVVERAGGLIPRRRRARLLRVRKNQPLDLLRLDSVVVAVREALANRGFADAEVGSRVEVDTAARRARVTLAIDPKARTTVGPITVRGNDRVSEETIRNSLRVEQGEVFRLGDVTESQRALYESGLFRRAEIAVSPATDTTRPQTDTSKSLVVTVQEAPPRAVRTSVGFNTFEFFQAGGRYTNYSLLGGARRLDVQGAVGNFGSRQLNQRFIFRNKLLSDTDESKYFAPTYQTSVDVTQRYVGDARNTVSVGVFANRRSSPLVFVDRGFGGTATFTREVGPRIPLSASYRFEVSGVEAGDVYFCVNFGVCERQSIDALNQSQRLSPLALTVSADRSDDLFGPTRGFRLRADVEHASQFSASDFRYNRFTAEGTYYRPGFGGTLAARLRMGGVQSLAGTNDAVGVDPLDSEVSLIHPRKRFYAGGSQSVRGYGENQLGPRVLTIPSTVLRGRRIAPRPGAPAFRDTTYVFCAPVNPIQSCNPNATGSERTEAGNLIPARLEATDFVPRPVGGDGVIEGSVEYRFPVLARLNLFGAVFLDGAVVTGESVAGRETVVAATPGFGIRYRSPVGPIRVDLGINPSLQDELRVITENDEGGEIGGLVELQGVVGSDGRQLVPARRQFAAYKRGGAVGDALGRLVLHLSIGEAF
jgi:outer membrane protein assembly factor BamA